MFSWCEWGISLVCYPISIINLTPLSNTLVISSTHMKELEPGGTWWGVVVAGIACHTMSFYKEWEWPAQCTFLTFSCQRHSTKWAFWIYLLLAVISQRLGVCSAVPVIIVVCCWNHYYLYVNSWSFPNRYDILAKSTIVLQIIWLLCFMVSKQVSSTELQVNYIVLFDDLLGHIVWRLWFR